MNVEQKTKQVDRSKKKPNPQHGNDKKGLQQQKTHGHQTNHPYHW